VELKKFSQNVDIFYKGRRGDYGRPGTDMEEALEYCFGRNVLNGYGYGDIRGNYFKNSYGSNRRR